MENMIVLAIKANASIKELGHDSIISFTESQLNDFLNLVVIETEKENR